MDYLVRGLGDRGGDSGVEEGGGETNFRDPIKATDREWAPILCEKLHQVLAPPCKETTGQGSTGGLIAKAHFTKELHRVLCTLQRAAPRRTFAKGTSLLSMLDLVLSCMPHIFISLQLFAQHKTMFCRVKTKSGKPDQGKLLPSQGPQPLLLDFQVSWGT